MDTEGDVVPLDSVIQRIRTGADSKVYRINSQKVQINPLHLDTRRICHAKASNIGHDSSGHTSGVKAH